MSKVRPLPSFRGGFALLEVLVALAIFTTVAVSLVVALDLALQAARERNEVEAATTGLANQLTIVRGEQLYPEEHDLPDDGSGIAYHLSIASEQMQNMSKQYVTGMYRVTVTAKWKSGSQADDRSVSELIYQP